MKPSKQIALNFICLILFGFNLYSANKTDKCLLGKDSTISKVEYQTVQFKVGFNIGWEFPYSAGAEFSFLFNELIDANFGCGLGFRGAKLGVGARIYPLKKSKFSPMLGTYFYHATGLNKLTVSVNELQGIYSITSDNAVLINTGLRYRYGKGNYIIAGIGYSIPFYGEKAIYRSGSNESSVKTFANALATGGLSVNFGILLKLSKGPYQKM
jgi:hypothetical protein